MNCPFCNTEIADNAKFCPRCGKKIADYKPPEKPRCPKCGAEIADYGKSDFCTECGYEFPAIEIKDFCVLPESEENLKAAKSYFREETTHTSGIFGFFKEEQIERIISWESNEIQSYWRTLKKDLTKYPRLLESSEITKAFDDTPVPGLALRTIQDPLRQFKQHVPLQASSNYYQLQFGVDNLRTDYSSPCFDKISLWLCPEPCRDGDTPKGVPVLEWDKIFTEESCKNGKWCVEAMDSFVWAPRLCAFLLPLTANHCGVLWPVLTISWKEKIFATAMSPFPLLLGNGTCKVNNRSGNLPAKRGLATNLPITSCRYSFRNGGNAFDLTASFANNTAEDSGALKLQLWFCGNDYNGGRINGTAMCESVLSVPSLKSGFFYKDLSLTNLGRIGNPPTGDYRVVLTLSELNEDGNWYIVGWSTFPNSQRWTQPRTKKSGFFTLQE